MIARTEAQHLQARLDDVTRQRRVELEQVRLQKEVALVTLLSGAPDLETLETQIDVVERLAVEESAAKTALILALDMELAHAKRQIETAVSQ